MKSIEVSSEEEGAPATYHNLREDEALCVYSNIRDTLGCGLDEMGAR